MPRKPRQGSPTGYYHFINRGVNRRQLFYGPADFDHYKALLRDYARRFEISVVHYCLLSNHTHLLLRSEEVSAISRWAHFLHRRYAYYFCKSHGQSEQVFKKHFVCKPIADERYLLECARYIERNPVQAKIVTDPADYPYSSYLFYAKGVLDELLERNPLYADLGYDDTERRAGYQALVRLTRIIEAEAPF